MYGTNKAKQVWLTVHEINCLSITNDNSARIKIHRYCAFYDIAVFTGKHCDLASTSTNEVDGQGPNQLQSCCTTLSETPSLHSSHSPVSSSPAMSDHPTPNSDSSLGLQFSSSLQFPFSRHHSSKICLKSALNIAEAFDALPYPNPTGKLSSSPCYIGYASPLITPRTMPAFACCAMQSCYVFLMIRDQTQALYPPARGGAGPLVDNMLDRLKQGLWSVWGAFVNYGAAFEALGGMRGKLRAILFTAWGANLCKDQVRDKIGATLAGSSPSFPI